MCCWLHAIARINGRLLLVNTKVVELMLLLLMTQGSSLCHLFSKQSEGKLVLYTHISC